MGLFGFPRVAKDHETETTMRSQAAKKGNKAWGSAAMKLPPIKGISMYFPDASEAAMGFTFNWLIGTFVTSTNLYFHCELID